MFFLIDKKSISAFSVAKVMKHNFILDHRLYCYIEPYIEPIK